MPNQYGTGTLAERYWAKVEKRGDDECWGWKAATDGHGYGRIQHTVGNPRIISASQASWEVYHGPIPSGKVVMHTCDNPPCSNPAHLRLGSMQDNTRDMMAKGRNRNQYTGVTHCIRGHEFTPENTYTLGGARVCRECETGQIRRRRPLPQWLTTAIEQADAANKDGCKTPLVVIEHAHGSGHARDHYVLLRLNDFVDLTTVRTGE